MAPSKKLSKPLNLSRSQRILGKKRILGAFLIISFVAFGATIVTYYLVKAKVDLFRTTLASLFIGGIIAVFIEMRGKMDKKISGIRNRRKTKSKTKTKKR